MVEAISDISPSPIERSDYEYFILPTVLVAFPSSGRRLSLGPLDKNREQFGPTLVLEQRTPGKARSARRSRPVLGIKGC